MTIKQQGGIFGRNPTFNEVSATDAEITNQLDVKTISMVSNNPVIYLDDTDVADLNTRLRNQSGIFRIQDVADDGSTTTQVQLAHSTGDLTVSTGNLVIGTSGKGIDFSATSGTGTSELFDDYEEGTWTPAVAAGAISGTSVSLAGSYTKVGNKVTVTFKATNTAGDIQISSYASLSGLPYAASSDQGGSSTIITEDIDQFSRQGFAAVGAGSSNLALSAAGSSSGTVKLQVSLTYLT